MTACMECDLLLQDVPVPPGGESLCPRCGHVLREGRPDSVLHALLLSITGLILFGPAIGLPLLSLSVTGLRQESSLTQAILALGDNGFWEVATMVSICAIIAPLLNLWILFTVSVVLQMRAHPPWLPTLMRLNHHVREWAMLEVFLMGVLVSMVKLKDIAELMKKTITEAIKKERRPGGLLYRSERRENAAISQAATTTFYSGRFHIHS